MKISSEKFLRHGARSWLRGYSGFTLIELLVVIAIIAILAAMFFTSGGDAKNKARLKVCRTELAQVQMGVEHYKTDVGFYPPDNPNDPAVNQLYYELSGMTNDPAGVFQTLDRSSSINAADVPNAFGATGFMNCTLAGGGGDNRAAKACLPGLKQSQIGSATIKGVSVKLLVTSVRWLGIPASAPIAGAPTLNPWHYVSSKPTNNPGTYDLWVDVPVGSKTIKVSN
jgi:prepilin-type N-terminal cleavage/methylation domain-containing protein